MGSIITNHAIEQRRIVNEQEKREKEAKRASFLHKLELEQDFYKKFGLDKSSLNFCLRLWWVKRTDDWNMYHFCLDYLDDDCGPAWLEIGTEGGVIKHHNLPRFRECDDVYAKIFRVFDENPHLLKEIEKLKEL